MYTVVVLIINFFVGTNVMSDDVHFLMCSLHKHAYKWREIGAALSFHHGELENIIQTFPRAAPQRLLTELLNQWSQWPTAEHPQAPTMERLCDALRSGQVGLGAEANDLYATRTGLPSLNKYSLL